MPDGSHRFAAPGRGIGTFGKRGESRTRAEVGVPRNGRSTSRMGRPRRDARPQSQSGQRHDKTSNEAGRSRDTKHGDLRMQRRVDQGDRVEGA